MAHDPAARAAVSEREALRLAQYEIIMDEMFRIATQGQREADRVSAQVAFANRVMGTPINRNLNADTDADRLVINVVTKFASVESGYDDGAANASSEAVGSAVPDRPVG